MDLLYVNMCAFGIFCSFPNCPEDTFKIVSLGPGDASLVSLLPEIFDLSLCMDFSGKSAGF